MVVLGPTLPADFSQCNYTQSRRPCLVHHDLVFRHSAEGLSHLRFQNYYSATVTVKQRLEDGDGGHSWQTVLRDHTLMRSPHSESGAQDWHTLSVTAFDERWKPENARGLRFYVFQPSPSWLKFELRSMTAHGAASEPALAGEHVGGESLSLQHPPELATLPKAKACGDLRAAGDELARQLHVQHWLQSHLANSTEEGG